MKKFHKLTPEDKTRIKLHIRDNTKFGKWFYHSDILGKSIYWHFKILISLCCAFGFIDVTFGGIFLTINYYYPNPIFRIFTIFCNTWLGDCKVSIYQNFTGNTLYDLAFWHFDTHHMLDVISFGVFYWLYAWKLKSLIYPAMIIPAIIAINEYSWWVSYIIAHIQVILGTQSWELIYFSNSIAVVYMILLIIYIVIKGWNIQDFKWLIVAESFYVFWILIGFPITYDFSGLNKINMASPFVNGIEVLHWWWFFTTHYIMIGRKMSKTEGIKNRII